MMDGNASNLSGTVSQSLFWVSTGSMASTASFRTVSPEMAERIIAIIG